MGAAPPGLDPSMLSGILGSIGGAAPSPDRSNDLMAGILSAVADHLRGAPPDSGKSIDMGEPASEKKAESKGPSEKKSPSTKSSGSKKPPSKKASSK
jgi:hypothetical protein